MAACRSMTLYYLALFALSISSGNALASNEAQSAITSLLLLNDSSNDGDPTEPTNPREIPFFNGVDFTGFEFSVEPGRGVENGAALWSIENGELVSDGNFQTGKDPQSGMYSVSQDYGQYELSLEYTYTENNGRANSGIWVLGGADLVDTKNTFPASIEVQLRKGFEGDLLVKQLLIEPEPGFPTDVDQNTPNGRILRRANPNVKPDGQWNSMKIVVEDTLTTGTTVSVWINDVFLNKGINAGRSKGRITFQAEGADIRFRNIKLVSLN